jgi:ubiquinone/menaquinone biosynthesis C-methylase UbiE
MRTPWQEIPLEDYEAHMSLPSVGQAGMLADQLAQLIELHTPASVAIIGCAGGNGLERIDSTQVERVVAIDVNPEYVAAAELRHAARLGNLDCRCADVQSETLTFDPVELIYAALVFEYVDVAATLATLKRNLQPGGTAAVILQLRHSDQQVVSASPYRSLDKLIPALKLVAPEDLRSYARAAGFGVGSSNRIDLPSGKQFWLQIFLG